MNRDPAVMQFMPYRLDREQSDAFVDRITQHFADHRFGLWAVEVLGGAAFIGYVGLLCPSFSAPFTPCVEIGWRLARDAWGHGYATEAAREAARIAFEEAGLNELVSFTVPANVRSRRVMERLAMVHATDEDFDHPLLPAGHPLRRHVLYRLSKQRWLAHQQPRPSDTFTPG